METCDGYYLLVEKICNQYELDSMFSSGFSLRSFVRQVHLASEGDIEMRFVYQMIEQYGIEKVFEKTIMVFALGKPFGGYLRKALQEGWKHDPWKLLHSTKDPSKEREEKDTRSIGEIYEQRTNQYLSSHFASAAVVIQGRKESLRKDARRGVCRPPTYTDHKGNWR